MDGIIMLVFDGFPKRPFRYTRPMIHLEPVVLERSGIRLEPMREEHREALTAAASDGRLWELWYVAVPSPEETPKYIRDALKGQEDGNMLPWVVRDTATGAIIGSTRYHDIVTPIDRVEIGYTWYAQSRQRTHVNTTCKLLLLAHAFDTIGCKVVGLRTDPFNFRSQRAIEALGAHKDGVLRHYGARRDGTARDIVLYSILASEWPDVRRHLELRLSRHARSRPNSI
jgi:N-acetyltransferase